MWFAELRQSRFALTLHLPKGGLCISMVATRARRNGVARQYAKRIALEYGVEEPARLRASAADWGEARTPASGDGNAGVRKLKPAGLPKLNPCQSTTETLELRIAFKDKSRKPPLQ